MKILFAIKSINHKGGGAEKVLSLVASGLAERKHEVSVLSFDEVTDDPFYFLDPRVIKIGLGIGNVKRSASLSETLVRMLSLRRTIISIKPDIVIGFMHSMYIPLSFSLFLSEISVIGSEHNIYFNFKYRKLQSLLLQWSKFFLKKIIVVSEQAKLTYPVSLNKRMSVIPNPIVLRIGIKANVVGDLHEKKVLLSVGRLTKQKDHITLIKAFALISNNFPNWIIHIVGDGELRKFLEKTIKDLNLVNKVFLKSTTKDIAVEYGKAQIFVLPSIYESFGLVVVEALAHGLPVVGFADCEGFNQLVYDNINGVFVKNSQGRVIDLSVALEKLMGDAQLRYKLSENCRLPEGYDINSVLDLWEETVRPEKSN